MELIQPTNRIISLNENGIIHKNLSYEVKPHQNTIEFYNMDGRNDHHRRPRSIGGFRDPRNLYKNAPKTKHLLWHLLFGTLNAFQIVDEINRNKYFGRSSISLEQIGKLNITLKEGDYGCKDLVKLKCVFDFMFREDRARKQKLDTINHLWLDPDFILVM